MARAKLLVAGRPIPFVNEQGLIAVDVPSIAVHEVIARSISRSDRFRLKPHKTGLSLRGETRCLRPEASRPTIGPRPVIL